ncbi:hypothetical protein L1887_05283 [Cichorium endivia]|nr:hypothetical protein L1887_05283 [Cichorium endivia]
MDGFVRTQKSGKKLKDQKFNMLEEGLVNLLVVGFGESGRKASEIRILLARIEESESFALSVGELRRVECLRSLSEIAIALAERPAHDEAKTNRGNGRNNRVSKVNMANLGNNRNHSSHMLCVGPILSEHGPQERMHLKSLFCKYESEEGSQELTFLQSFITSIQKWADKQLSDYHLKFPEALAMMENVVSISILAKRLLQEEHGSIETISGTLRWNLSPCNNDMGVQLLKFIALWKRMLEQYLLVMAENVKLPSSTSYIKVYIEQMKVPKETSVGHALHGPQKVPFPQIHRVEEVVYFHINICLLGVLSIEANGINAQIDGKSV